MLATLRAKRDADEGFTLIELLVVIIIIGILAAIAIPVFLNQRKRATEASMTSDLKTIANEMEVYYTDFQSYPTIAATAGRVVVGTTTVNLSKGNVAATSTDGAFTTPGGYCIGIYNNEVGGIPGARYYSSTKGGVLPKGAACTA